MLPCLNWATSLETVVVGNNNSDRCRRKEQHDFGAWHILRNVIPSTPKYVAKVTTIFQRCYRSENWVYAYYIMLKHETPPPAVKTHKEW